MQTLDEILADLGPRSLLEALAARLGKVTLLDHWKQGEFHHDLVFAVPDEAPDLGGRFLVVSTNCNGGVKEILCLAERPARWALWRHRCPENPEFEGDLPAVLGVARSHHYFDPCELLRPDARSELRPEWRRRQTGGGWVPLDSKEP